MAIQDGFSPAYWKRERLTIDALATKLTGLIPTTAFHAARYHFSFYNESESKSKTFDMVINREGSSVKDIITNKIGASINLAVDSNIVGGNMEISIENKEAFAVEVELFYLLIGQ